MLQKSCRFRQENEIGADEAPVILPPAMCAEAVHANQYSIVGVLINPEKQCIKRLINQLPCIWGLPGEVIDRMLDSRMFQFVFPTEKALTRVLRTGPWSFADWMIVTKRWAATVIAEDLVTAKDLKMVQFWVHIRGIPPHYLSRAIIEFIGNTLAHVVAVNFEGSTNFPDYVWVLVNWNIDNPLRFKRKNVTSFQPNSMVV